MFYLAQAGSTLQRVDIDGTVTTLTLPDGVTIDATVRGVFAVLGGVVIFARASSINLVIDPATFAVTGLGLEAPLIGPVLAIGTNTGLTGIYSGKVSYAIKDSNGIVINESPLSQKSANLSVTNTGITWGQIPLSSDVNVNCRILWRTAAGGTVYFKLLEIDDNITTTITNNNTSDAALSLLPASATIANPPGTTPGTHMKLLIEWQGRLWGVSDTPGERDDARFTELGSFYQWDEDNSIPAKGKGEDSFGITAFVRRRDDLGVFKRNRIMKIIGDAPSNFQVIGLDEAIGCIAPDSVVVIRNKAYWLNHDGVYRWDENGVVNISDASVDPWFTTDTYFNRDRFQYAFASWNAAVNAYELSLAAVGSMDEDRWVSFHIDADGGRGAWLGPHLTTAFVPSSRVQLNNDEGIAINAIGAEDGYLYLQNQTTPNDIEGDATVHLITANLRDRFLHDGNPNIWHFWGRLSVLTRIESGGTLSVTPYIGGVDASAGTAMSYGLTRGQQVAPRASIGRGRLCSLLFSQATVDRRFLLFGYELDDVHELEVRGLV
jgi:hypothetical protein